MLYTIERQQIAKHQPCGGGRTDSRSTLHSSFTFHPPFTPHTHTLGITITAITYW